MPEDFTKNSQSAGTFEPTDMFPLTLIISCRLS
jgi:hypothetical protein